VFSVVLFVAFNALFLWRARRQAQRSTGAFRILFYVPMLPLVFVTTRLAWDTARDPTSHNLWPFEYVIVGAPCALVWWALKVVRRRAGAELPGRDAA